MFKRTAFSATAILVGCVAECFRSETQMCADRVVLVKIKVNKEYDPDMMKEYNM